MDWFRAKRGVAAWLALFALACQLTFSFGHVHVIKTGLGPSAQAAAQTMDAVADPPAPPKKNPAGPAADFCAICANISLAGALILPILALILAPGLFIKVLQWPLATPALASSGHSPFRARGPPLA